MKITLLLTSTLTPAGLPAGDSDYLLKRHNEYRDSLHKWMMSSIFNEIVFCDNSGLSIPEIEELLEVEKLDFSNSRLELLTYKDKADKRYHYGHSELGLIDHALLHSKFLHHSDYFVKCTGRLFYPKLRKLIDNLEFPFKFVVDSRSDVLWVKNEQVTTQLFIFNKKYYMEKMFESRAEMTVSEFYIEHFLYRKLIEYRGSHDCIFRFPFELLAEGSAGHSAESYRSWRKLISSSIRSACRRFIPRIWV